MTDALDLRPVDPVDDGGGASSRRRVLPMVIVGLVLVAMGFVVFRTLGDAALFFYNADEAIEQRDDLADRRFRLQGTPFGDPISTEVNLDGRLEVAVVFPVNFEGAIVDVVHVGAPAELFQPGVPVVLEGQWRAGLPDGVDRVEGGANDGWHFSSSEMVVKHDNEYRTDNQERLDDADRGGYVPET